MILEHSLRFIINYSNVYILILGNYRYSKINFFQKNKKFQKIQLKDFAHIKFKSIFVGYSFYDYSINSIFKKFINSQSNINYFLDSWISIEKLKKKFQFKVLTRAKKIFCIDYLMKKTLLNKIDIGHKNIIPIKKFNNKKLSVNINKLIFFLWPDFFNNKSKSIRFLKFLGNIKNYDVYIKYHPAFSKNHILKISSFCKKNKFTLLEKIEIGLANYSYLVGYFSSTLIQYNNPTNMAINFTFYQDIDFYGWKKINLYEHYQIKYAKNLRELKLILKC